MATGNIENLLPTCRNVSKYTAAFPKARLYSRLLTTRTLTAVWKILLIFYHIHITCCYLSMNYFTRSLSHSVFLLDDRLWNPPVFPGGLCRSIHRQGRDVRRGTTGPHIQGRRLLCHHDGLPGECLLHHRGHLDPLLSLQHLHGFPQSPVERL